MNLSPPRLIVLSLLTLALHLGCAQSPSAAPAPAPNPAGIRISPQQSAAIGRKIWNNESSGTISGLTSWNRGEYFASLGIGHFIWYHPSKRGPFDESFPKLLGHMKQRRVPLPAWLASARGCPWATYEEFHADTNSTRMTELRNLLANTIPIQTDFIVQRLEQALPKILRTLKSSDEQNLVRARFYAVAESPQGVYALIDYVNFKGEGIKLSERYAGQGWGLLQVLQEMRGTPRGSAAAREFSEAAKRVLQRRVRNAPPDRNESRWLAGWMKRCNTYAQPL